MNQQDLLKLKEDFGYNKLSYKYIPAGSEILRYIGQAVVVVTFKKIWRTEKDEEGNDVKKYSLEDHMERGYLLSLSDFDPMTKTYLCKYKIDGQEEEKETRIQPEGVEFVNLDDDLFHIPITAEWLKTSLLRLELKISSKREIL